MTLLSSGSAGCSLSPGAIDPTDVGQKVGTSRNDVNRPTDKPSHQNGTLGRSRICPLHCGIEDGGVDTSPPCSIPNQLNPALNGKRADPNRGRPLTMVARAGFEPTTFGL